MGTFTRAIVFGLTVIAVNLTLMPKADAKCTRLAFSVNDYGKDGPTADAKKLLDKYIAKWTSERSITGYRVGKKSVSCKLFLDFIVFDEYTCRAEASVCWGDAKASPELRPAQSAAPEAPASAKPQTAQVKAPPVPLNTEKPEETAPAAPSTGQAVNSDADYNRVYEAQ